MSFKSGTDKLNVWTRNFERNMEQQSLEIYSTYRWKISKVYRHILKHAITYITVHISPISTNSHEGNKVLRCWMEKRHLRRGNGATRATQPWRSLLWNFSHSDPLRTITKWLAENVRNIIGARRGFSSSFSSRRHVRGTKFLARPRISVGSAENSEGTWYCDVQTWQTSGACQNAIRRGWLFFSSV